MIERQTINGRDATIAYIDDRFQPIDDLSKPHIAKVLFDDGEMLILTSPGNEPAAAEPFIADDSDEHQHDGEAWAKHRVRTGQKKTLRIYGRDMASWARDIANQDAHRIHSAISVGLTAGEDNTDIAHRVIGSRRLNGVNGATEITRQHILRLGKGLLHKRKSRMSGASADGPQK